MLPDVSIVLPARDGDQALACIDSLAAACPLDVTFDLTIVPLSDDPTLHEALSSLEGDVRILPVAPDFGTGCVAGAEATAARWLLFVDDTARPTAEVAGRIVTGRLLPDSARPVQVEGPLVLSTREHVLALADIATAAYDAVALGALLRFAHAATNDASPPAEGFVLPTGIGASFEPGLVSVVVPVSEQAPWLRQCVESVLQHSRRPFELIVAHSEGSEPAGDLARHPLLRTVSVADGAAAAELAAAGLLAARGEFIAFVDDTTVVNRFWLDGLLAPLSDPRVAATGPRSNVGSPSQLATVPAYTTLTDMRRVAEQWRQEHRGGVSAAARLEAFCVLFRRAALVADNGQGDLFERLVADGWLLRVADAVFVHREEKPRLSATGAWHGIPALAGATPLLTACLIVKNEQRWLPQCLGSLAGLVDEVVVCDTGSTDRTVEIAEAMGAEVTHFEWIDDFAAARNAALAPVTGRWILQIDADEEVVVSSVETVRGALVAAQHDAITVGVRSYSGDGVHDRTVVDTWAPRLLRAGTFHYEGRLHEAPIARDGQRVMPVGVAALTLRHYGYTNDMLDERNKRERNLHLAELNVADAPDDIIARFDHARTLALNGRAEEAEAAFRVLLANPRGLSTLAQTVAWRTLASSALLRDEIDEALDAARAAVRLDPHNAEGRVLLSRALLAADRPEEALEALGDDESLKGALITDKVAEQLIVPLLRWLILVKLGRRDEATELPALLARDGGVDALAALSNAAGVASRPVLHAAARRFEEENPRIALAVWRGLGDDPVSRLGVARCLVALGEVDGALAHLDTLAAATLPQPEDILFTAALALAAGRTDLVRSMLTTVPLPFPHLAEALELAGAAGADVQEEVEAYLAS